ncbi:MAG: PH domain-containing protein [Patescibacteria group bacterium]
MLDLNHLPGSSQEEQTKAVLRRHWMTLLSLTAAFILVLFLPLIVISAVQYASPMFFDDPARTTLLVLGLSIFFLYAWLFLFQNYIDYHLDVWIVTDHRILNIEQHGLFARTVSELRLYRVQDVTAEIKGFLHTMLDYGNVYIQTAGEKERFLFEDIPHPNQVTKMVLDLAEIDRKQELGEAVEEFQSGEA